MKSATPEGPRVIDAAERAKLHERYIDKFMAVLPPCRRAVTGIASRAAATTQRIFVIEKAFVQPKALAAQGNRVKRIVTNG